jgi:hypothetical protein
MEARHRANHPGCQHPFEVVLLNVTIPDLNGVCVAAELRAFGGPRRTQFVFHTDAAPKLAVPSDARLYTGGP